MEHFERPLSRRQLLQYGAGGLAAASLGPLLAACGGSSNSSSGGGPATLKMWWWGQQEAVGIQKWMQDTVAKFKANTGNTIAPTLMSTDNVIPQFTNAAAAGHPPDIQFLFNGIYHMTERAVGPKMMEYLLHHFDRVPMKRLVRPEEVAGAFAYLASDDASGVTGINLTVDCGLTANWYILETLPAE